MIGVKHPAHPHLTAVTMLLGHSAQAGRPPVDERPHIPGTSVIEMAHALRHTIQGAAWLAQHPQRDDRKPAKPVYRDARHRRQVELKQARQAAAAKRGKRS